MSFQNPALLDKFRGMTRDRLSRELRKRYDIRSWFNMQLAVGAVLSPEQEDTLSEVLEEIQYIGAMFDRMDASERQSS